MDNKSFSLKPMSVGGILDNTFTIYRKNFVTIMAFSALIGGLFSLLTLFLVKINTPAGLNMEPLDLIIDGIKSGNLDNLDSQTSIMDPTLHDSLGFVAMWLISMAMGILNVIFIQPFVRGGIANVVHNYSHGKKLDAELALKDTWQKFGKLILTSLCLIVCYIVFAIVYVIALGAIVAIFGIGAASTGSAVGAIIGAIIIAVAIILILVAFLVFISFTYPVVVCEGKSNFDAIKRSFKLVSQRFWRILGTTLLISILSYLIIGAIGGILFFIAVISPVNVMFQQVITMISSAIVTPIIYIANTLLYYDVRIRKEGYDLQFIAENTEGNQE